MVFWIAFNSFILLMLALDLGVFQKKETVITLKQSAKWIALWVSLALIFNVVVYFWKGQVKAMEFFTGYIIEMSLSVDNLFVFIVIFSYFNVPKKYEHRVLFWGILVALVLRGFFIITGVALFNAFNWMIYIFGAILVYTGIKMFFHKENEHHDLSENFTVKLCRKVFPISDDYDGHNFFTRINGKFFFTPLFLVLMVINITDVVFALDSIPAVLAVSSDTFIVYTSNIFAILGLRSIYFALSGMMHLFRFLKYGLALILSFVGLKMLASEKFVMDTGWTLAIVAAILALSTILSLVIKPKTEK
ncbi:MAG: TerC family protein [Bacteroidota bacterium]